jgi:hypothetical protein
MDILEGLGDDAVKDYRVNIEEQMRSALDENQKAVLAEKEA